MADQPWMEMITVEGSGEAAAAVAKVGLGRIVVSDIKVPIVLVNMV